MAALEALNNKKYDIVGDIVEDIHNRCIRMDVEEKRALVSRFQRVILKFIEKMKGVDAVFEQVFNRIGYTGSFFEGLRVREATEYDLNLILKPKALKLKTEKSRSPGFISITVDENQDNLPRHFKQWMTDDGYQTFLDSNLVSNWLQSVVYRTIKRLDKEDNSWFEDCEIKVRRSGPAWTLVIVSHEYPIKTIDVDLVPVLEFPSSEWPVRRRYYGGRYDTWFAVPKPPRDYRSAEWRLSFPQQETEIIKRSEYLKYTLRLLKQVRDQFGFNAIASYYIKTLFLWEVERQDRSIWMRSRRGRLFIYMLIQFQEALEEEKILFYWDEDCNLIGHIKSSTLYNFSRRLKGFLKDINYLIDHGKHNELKAYISNALSTRSEEQQTDEQSWCTIL